MAKPFTVEDRFKRLALNPYQRELKDRVGMGRDHWGMCTGRLVASWADWMISVWKRGMRGPHAGVYKPQRLERALETPRGEPAIAFVVHNRWIARCECGGAEVVDYAQARFFCLSCFNVMHGGHTRPVEFPPNWTEIEDRLITRPDPVNRNWSPTESLPKLEAENAAIGVAARRGRQ